MKLSFVRIDGTVPGSERQRRIDAFNDPGTPPPTVSPTTPPTVGTPTVSPTAPPTVGTPPPPPLLLFPLPRPLQ